MKHYFYLLITFASLSCNGNKEKASGDAPVATQPQLPANTSFVVTPEAPLPEGNVIYTAAPLLAWQEVKKEFGTGLLVSDKYSVLKALNNSKAYRNTLSLRDYSVSRKLDNTQLTLSCAFKKYLPFAYDFNVYSDSLEFSGKKVRAFGSSGHDLVHIQMFDIVYFKDNSEFIVALETKGGSDEILLYMPATKPASFKAALLEIEARRKTGKSERERVDNKWKYEMEEQDGLMIPVLKLKGESALPGIVGAAFNSGRGTNPIKITAARQTVLFTLDEKGGRVEAEAEIAVPAAAMLPTERPAKRLYFDKPFLIIIKKKASTNPYFAMWVDGREVMIQE